MCEAREDSPCYTVIVGDTAMLFEFSNGETGMEGNRRFFISGPMVLGLLLPWPSTSLPLESTAYLKKNVSLYQIYTGRTSMFRSSVSLDSCYE